MPLYIHLHEHQHNLYHNELLVGLFRIEQNKTPNGIILNLYENWLTCLYICRYV